MFECAGCGYPYHSVKAAEYCEATGCGGDEAA